jgi:hypothetical protein
MAEEACAGNLQAGFCEEGPLQLRGPLLDAGGGAIPPVYSPSARCNCNASTSECPETQHCCDFLSAR